MVSNPKIQPNEVKFGNKDVEIREISSIQLYLWNLNFNVFYFEVEFQHINAAIVFFDLNLIQCVDLRGSRFALSFFPCTLLSRTGARREIQQKITHSDILSYS